MPDGYDIDDVKKILSDYNQLVDVTESVEFNPYVFSFGKYKKEFDLFFNWTETLRVSETVWWVMEGQTVTGLNNEFMW